MNMIGKFTYLIMELGHFRLIMNAMMGRIAPTKKKNVKPLGARALAAS